MGDIVLKKVAGSIMASLRPSDLVVRMGGEEFAVIMPETELTSAINIAERLRERIEKLSIPFKDSPRTMSVTVSVGGACVTDAHDEIVDTLLKRADTALYKAKESGRNRVIAADEAGAAHA